MFFEKYKDTFLNDKSNPYSGQLSKLRQINKGQNGQTFSNNAKRMFQNSDRLFSNDSYQPNIQAPQFEQMSSNNYKEHQSPIFSQNAPQQRFSKNRQPSHIYQKRAAQMLEPHHQQKNAGTSQKLQEAFTWDESRTNVTPFSRRLNPQTQQQPLKIPQGEQQDIYHTGKQKSVDEPNRISYNFFTGEDFDKRDPQKHIYINNSDGVMDMFSAFQVNRDNNNGENKQQEMSQDVKESMEVDKFQRSLVDARKLLMPKHEADNLQEIANKVFPAERFEAFMASHINDPRRSKQFKDAINRRIQAKLGIEAKRQRLKQMIDRESRRRHQSTTECNWSSRQVRQSAIIIYYYTC